MTQDAAVQAWHPPSILRMDFQPIIDTARGTVAGYESLARFEGPANVGPDCWFALAHAAGPSKRASDSYPATVPRAVSMIG